MLWDASGWDGNWDDPDSFLLYADKIDMLSGVLIRFEVIYDGYYQLVIDGVDIGPPVYCTAGFPLEMSGNYPFPMPDGKHIVTVAAIGPWNSDFFGVVWQQQLFQQGRNDRISFTINANPDLFSVGDRGQLKNWKLSGIVRYQNCRPQNDRRTWAEMDVTIHTETGSAGTNATFPGDQIISLSLGTAVLAQGRATPQSDSTDAIVQLLPYNGSGVFGTVEFHYTHDCTGILVAAFPTAYKVYYREGTPWSSADFSTTHHAVASDTIVDDGHSIAYPYESPPLSNSASAATDGHDWYVVVHQVSDTQVEGTNANNSVFNIQYIPKPPGALELVAGGSGGDTVVMFAASADHAAQYNLYDSEEAGILPLSPTRVLPTGIGIQFVTLTDISSSFTGSRFVCVRSLLDHVESDNTDILEIKYIDGIAQNLLPNSPAMSIQITCQDRTLTVPFTYDTAQQDIAPSVIQLFAWGVDDPPDLTTPIGTVALSSPKIGTVIYNSVSGTVLTDGEYYYSIKALGPNGPDTNVNVAGPIRLTFAEPLDPILTP